MDFYVFRKIYFIMWENAARAFAHKVYIEK